MFELKNRRICLDFHTSPHIPEVGADFDPDEFGDAMQKAHVQSIQLFSRCHHGCMYYQSKRFPERVHPHLARPNLLGEQIGACKKRGIQAMIYVTVQWDDYTATQHPEWLTRDEQGRPTGNAPYEPGFYNNLCVNTPYRDMLKEMAGELIETFDWFDSILFDIVQTKECSCVYCQDKMLSLGMDPSRGEDRKAYAIQMMNSFKLEMTRFVHSMKPGCGVFYNRGYVGVAERKAADAYTFYDIESLPGGHWGYMNFPVASRYVRNLGKDADGQTGKFHTTWGDFGSYRNRAALEFECFNIIAMNFKCLVGDQMHPRGRLDKTAYELIGAVYAQVKEKEAWCLGAKALTDICVFTPEEFFETESGSLRPSIVGATRMLQELGHQFDIVDSAGDISGYKLAILPDEIPVDEHMANKLNGFTAAGGCVIASYVSGLYQNGAFWDGIGAAYKGPAPYSPDYIVPEGEIGAGLADAEYVMYRQGALIEAAAETEALAWVNVPYFNRTWRRFSSHQHTPSSGKRGYPGAIRNGNVIYFMHPLFSMYDHNAPRWCKMLLANAVDMLMPRRLVRHDGPSTVLAVLNTQPDMNRHILHALHYIPERRGKTIDIVEDVIPLYNLSFTLDIPERIKTVKLAPQMAALDFQQGGDGLLRFTVPAVFGHQMTEIAY